MPRLSAPLWLFHLDSVTSTSLIQSLTPEPAISEIQASMVKIGMAGNGRARAPGQDRPQQHISCSSTINVGQIVNSEWIGQ
ncbi:hypothetical protein CY34DRAFT_797389 [Suillus luteus UH-Slu-Lm8-n1]|uniref:Uncharacterized protein n=1 Tax=Suillus luteus UH-Slu-Lm8-n1 TaxID=930992 RepID=A0A0D0BHE2_9AGAM|nr:hypothetical protein CY34DRAFT_797389 [Suillus luteus UH-Slu-Lm8-n1]